MAKTKTITGYFVDPENNIAEPRTIDKSLEGYYALLRCDCITMPERRIGDKYFTIIADDEGLLKPGAIISGLSSTGQPALVGPLFVVKFDGREDVTSLTKEELTLLAKHTRQGLIDRHDDQIVIAFLLGVEY